MTIAELRIRPMTQKDAPAVTPLLSQLGYNLDSAEVLRRFHAIRNRADHGLFVGEMHNRAIALLHVFERPAMEKPPEAVVQALIVDAPYRRTGAGRKLMQFAETWARQRGLDSVCLGSRVDRDDAHSFYGRLGYRRIAISHMFRKSTV